LAEYVRAEEVLERSARMRLILLRIGCWLHSH
jgi:hypothetical protein